MEIKVFVVDDEERQRLSIVKHVDWKRYHMRVIGEAEDAAGTLESAELNPPDLLITDIRLLGTDGLELSSRMRRINPRMHIIMVTGFEEFEYAKSALDIGVDAFLVKPIIFDELNVVLDRIYQTEWMGQSKSREEIHLKEQLDVFKPIAQEQFLQEVIHGLIVGEEAVMDRAGSFGMFARKGLRRVLLLVIDTESASPLPKEEQIQRVKAVIEESAMTPSGSLLEEQTTTQRGNIVLILQDHVADDFELATDSFMKQLGLDDGSMDFCKVSIGIGPSVSALSQLSESFRLAQIAVNQRLLGGDGHTFSWKLLMKQEQRPEKNIEELISDFLEVLGAGDSQNSLSLLGEILSRITGNLQIQGTKLSSLCMQLISGAYRTATEIGDANRSLGPEEILWEQLLDCREESELLSETVRIINGICDFIAERKKSHTQIVVQKALKYMNEHYRDNLSLRLVAESVYLSPNYMGALFRTELGVSFTDQLIQIRIEKAKEMLQQSHLKLYEVAEGVGYQNIGYFTGLFKRITGFSPKEYRSFLGFSNSD